MLPLRYDDVMPRRHAIRYARKDSTGRAEETAEKRGKVRDFARIRQKTETPRLFNA